MAGVKPGVRPTNEDFGPVERQHVEEDWRVVDTPCAQAGVPVGRVLVTREMLAGTLELINASEAMGDSATGTPRAKWATLGAAWAETGRFGNFIPVREVVTPMRAGKFSESGNH